MQYSNSDDPIDSQTYEALGRYIAKFSLFEAHLCDLFRLTLSLDESASLLIKSVIETSAFMKLTFEIYQRKVGNIETQLVTDCKNVIEYRNRSVHSKIFTQVTGNPISTSDTSKITLDFATKRSFINNNNLKEYFDDTNSENRSSNLNHTEINEKMDDLQNIINRIIALKVKLIPLVQEILNRLAKNDKNERTIG